MKKHMHEQNRLWDYEILRQLGKGSYGTVFEVKSKKNGKIYALKKINISGIHEKQKIQAFRQIKALKLLQHAYIIEYYESFLSMDNIYIVTEFAEKGDLSVEIKKRVKQEKKFTQDELWEVIEGLVAGLKHLHEKNIVHRDIKVQNIFQTLEGKFKIGDLGMSKITYGVDDLFSTRVGTPIYFAPEIIQHRMYTFPVDIWALGCVLFTMAALQHPYKDATIETLGYYIVDKDPKPIKGPYSPQIISFIFSMLDKNPQTRPTIYDLHKKLKQRKQQKITNKISIFNLKQILSLKADHLQIKKLSKSKLNKSQIKHNQQENSPTLLHLQKQSNTKDNNPQLLKPQKRNYSLLIPKKNKIFADKTRVRNMSPMIKSNGFDFQANQESSSLSPIKRCQITSHYNTNNLSFSETTSPHKRDQKKPIFIRRNIRPTKIQLV